MDETEKILELYEQVPEEYLLSQPGRLLLIYEWILAEDPLFDELEKIHEQLDKDQDLTEKSAEMAMGLEVKILDKYQEEASLALLDFIPTDNEELLEMKHRYQLLAIVHFLENQEEEENTYTETLAEIVAEARENLAKIDEDLEDGLDSVDQSLTDHENIFMAAYFPEVIEEILEEVKEGG